MSRKESLFYRSLISDAYLGNWYLMDNKALPYDGFIQKNGRQWVQGKKTPYTGWYAQHDSNKTARLLCSFFEGIREGPVAQWDSEGNLILRGAYLAGKKHGVFTGWNNVGIRVYEKEYASGRLDGWNYFWYDNAQLRLRLLFESENSLKQLVGTQMAESVRTQKSRRVQALLSIMKMARNFLLDYPKK